MLLYLPRSSFDPPLSDFWRCPLPQRTGHYLRDNDGSGKPYPQQQKQGPIKTLAQVLVLFVELYKKIQMINIDLSVQNGTVPVHISLIFFQKIDTMVPGTVLVPYRNTPKKSLFIPTFLTFFVQFLFVCMYRNYIFTYIHTGFHFIFKVANKTIQSSEDMSQSYIKAIASCAIGIKLSYVQL